MFAHSLIGTILLGRYRVEDVLGIGGMGVVVRAVHTELDTQVAVKFLLPHMAESPGVVQRFLREAQAAVKLKGAHVAKVIDVGKLPDGSPFMLMEYLSGADLGQILKAHGAQPAPVACDLLLQICEGMSEAHALGIVHRDVKPSNFFVTRNPDGSPLVKILDFGISKVPVGNDVQLTGTQSMVGTPAYMAPEHMRAANRADQRSDLWAMGVVLYQLLTNRLPFDGESYADLCLKVAMEQPAPILTPLPPGLGEVLLRCLEKDATQRFQSVAQLAYALAPFCSDPVAAAVAAERCGRILEAPRGPRAPTLGAAEALGSAVPLTPYSQSGHRSHNSKLRSNPSNPSSLSAGVGEMAAASGGPRSRVSLYAAGIAVVLVLGVVLGVFAAGSSDEGNAAAPGASIQSATSSGAASGTPAPAATHGSPSEKPEGTAPELGALQGGAEPEAKPEELQGGAEPEAKPEELQGGAEPEPEVKPEVKAADAKPTKASDDRSSERKDERKDAAKAGSSKAKEPAIAKKKKKKDDLFQSRE